MKKGRRDQKNKERDKKVLLYTAFEILVRRSCTFSIVVKITTQQIDPRFSSSFSFFLKQYGKRNHHWLGNQVMKDQSWSSVAASYSKGLSVSIVLACFCQCLKHFQQHSDQLSSSLQCINVAFKSHSSNRKCVFPLLHPKPKNEASPMSFTQSESMINFCKVFSRFRR